MKRNFFSRYMGLLDTLVMTSVVMTITLLGQPALAQSSRELLVVDANDIVIGVAQGLNAAGASVAFEYMGKVYAFDVGPYKFQTSGKWVYFESTNCSGTPYIKDWGTVGALAVVVAPGNQVYIPIPSSSTQPIITQSQVSIYGNGKCEQPNSQSEVNAFPADKLIELNSVFTPPFKYRFSD